MRCPRLIFLSRPEVLDWAVIVSWLAASVYALTT